MDKPGETVQNRTSIFESTTGWYSGWYFDLRLEEEMYRAKRHDYPTTLLLIGVTEDLGDSVAPRRREFNRRLAAIAKEKIRRADITGVLGSDRFAVCLPYTTVERAAVVASRITRALEGFHILIGLADTTQTGPDVDALTAAAQPRAGG